MQTNYDLVIIGAGPGAMQLAIRLQELVATEKLNYCIIEKNSSVGSNFKKYPVHKKLISINKLYTGSDPKSTFSERFDWNSLITKDKSILMRNYSKEFFPNRNCLVNMLVDLKKAYNLPIKFNTRWEKTTVRKDKLFEISTDKGILVTKILVIATGVNAYIAPIDGIEHATPYEHMRHSKFYRNKRVLIIGKGNSAMECADNIVNEATTIMLASPKSTRLAYQTHYVGDVRTTNMLIAENYQLKQQAALLDCNITTIKKESDGYAVTLQYTHANNETETLFFNELICATGFHAACANQLKELDLSMVHHKFPAIDGSFESKNINNLFFAGILTHALDYRKTFSGFIHGFRYNSLLLAHHIAEKLQLTASPQQISKTKAVNTLINQLATSGALYLQPGFIVYVLKYANKSFIDYGNMTLNKFLTLTTKPQEKYIAVSLEYGDIHQFKEVFNIPRYPGDADASVHIHPVIRIRSYDVATTNINLEELLESNYAESPSHIKMLNEIIANVIASPQQAIELA